MRIRAWIVLAVMLVLMSVLAPAAFAQYDREATVKVMRASGALLGQVNAAAGAKDFYAAADKLMELARGFKSLDEVAPPKGSDQEWDRIHADLILAAFRAIGACGAQDADKLKAEVGVLMGLMKEGHAKFR